MIVTASDVSSLSESLSRWEVIEYVSECFVIVGCTGELISDFFTRIPDQVRRHIGTLSTIVLILALAVGLTSLIKTNQLSGEVIGSLGSKSEEANVKAEQSITDSDQARSRASSALDLARQAQREAVISEKEAVQAEGNLARSLQRTSRLEKQLSWRTVTPEQTTAIKDSLYPLRLKSLLPFRGIKIRFTYESSDAEAGEYALELAETLRKALDGFGAEIGDPQGALVMFSGPTPTGLLIEVHSRNGKEAEAAYWLQKSLKAAGIEAQGQLGASEMTINFFVGSKPHDF